MAVVQPNPAEKIRIAIVGGGIAGLYCCYHLMMQAQAKHWEITLYESSDHVGGRIETWRIDPNKFDELDANNQLDPIEHISITYEELSKEDDNNTRLKEEGKNTSLRDILVAEFGPMRIEPEHQLFLQKLLSDLHIQPPEPNAPQWSNLIPFPSYQSEEPTEPKFNLQGEEADQESLIDLLLLGLRRIFEVIEFKQGDREQDPEVAYRWEKPHVEYMWEQFRSQNYLNHRYWKGYLREWINLLDDPEYDLIRKYAWFRITPLHDMGFWNV